MVVGHCAGMKCWNNKEWESCVVCNGACTRQLWKRHKHARSDLFCTSMCCNARDGDAQCKYGDKCQFAHSAAELLPKKRERLRNKNALAWKTNAVAFPALQPEKVKCKECSAAKPDPKHRIWLEKHSQKDDIKEQSTAPAEPTVASKHVLCAFPPGKLHVLSCSVVSKSVGDFSDAAVCGEFAESILRFAICD